MPMVSEQVAAIVIFFYNQHFCFNGGATGMFYFFG